MDLSEVGRALASPTRLQILRWLKDPEQHFSSQHDGDMGEAGVCASLIAAKVGASQPTVSRHLEVLRRAGLLVSERIAGRNFHRRDEDALAEARRLLTEL
ncbi:MAG TPA: metalloregulator ArsR/SmtB family transcription factor [Trebonia sp.]|nr:metalloregulator ArsR/SmtB family transcription factor [Trebonia sp.]